MIPKNSVKPLELVISALHCLKERKGSSPQNILKYLVEKYNVSEKAIKTHVQCGLKRGLSFGLITRKSGLYCLNDILGSPSNVSSAEFNKKKSIFNKPNKGVKKKKLRTIKKGKRKYANCTPPKSKRKIRKSKDKKFKKKRRSAFLNHPRRNLNEMKRRKSNRQKNKTEKSTKTKTEKVKRMLPDEENKFPPEKTEGTETQCCNPNNNDFEFVKTNVKA